MILFFLFQEKLRWGRRNGTFSAYEIGNIQLVWGLIEQPKPVTGRQPVRIGKFTALKLVPLLVWRKPSFSTEAEHPKVRRATGLCTNTVSKANLPTIISPEVPRYASIHASVDPKLKHFFYLFVLLGLLFWINCYCFFVLFVPNVLCCLSTNETLCFF